MSDLTEFFGRNELVVEKVRAAALLSREEMPFVPMHLSNEDRWHIMNICLNRVSALFGTLHVFFNEARRCKSYYRSAWYLLTVSFSQNVHRGRFFVTPYKPVLSKVDVGTKRLRIDLVNESEMRDICAGTVCAPEWGLFNSRHKHRWEFLQKMSNLFENQLIILNDERGPVHPSSPGMRRPLDESPQTEESCNLSDSSSDSEELDRLSPHHLPPNPRELARHASRIARHHECCESDNCMVRVHIPYPSSMIDPNPPETHAKDVVLFE